MSKIFDIFNLKKKNASLTESSAFPVCGKYDFASSEAYKKLRTNINFSFADTKCCHVVGVTSPERGEGKSLTCINTAYTMAQDGRKVLLIDADLRLSSVAAKMNIADKPGLSDVLVGSSSFDDAIRHYSCDESENGFDILVAGNTPPNPAELLNSEVMIETIEKLKDGYDYIFIDLPPVCAVADALIVSKITDGMVVIVRRNHCTTANLKETVEQLQFAKANIIGFVFNGATASSSYYKKGKYGRYYKNNDYESKSAEV